MHGAKGENYDSPFHVDLVIHRVCCPPVRPVLRKLEALGRGENVTPAFRYFKGEDEARV